MKPANIDQKEYLKKYLSRGGEDKKKKKKRKKANQSQRFQVVDDDIDLKNMLITDGNLYDLAEDAPNIVGFVDERPYEVKALEMFKSSKWKLLDDSSSGTAHYIDATGDLNESRENFFGSAVSSKQSEKQDKKSECEHIFRKKPTVSNDDSDVSPPRNSRTACDSDESPPRSKFMERSNSSVETYKRTKTRCYDSDISPPRKSRKGSDSDESPSRIARDRRETRIEPKSELRGAASFDDSDESPQRKSKVTESRNVGVSSRKKSRRFDDSPPRRTHLKNSSQPSGLRKNHNENERSGASEHNKRSTMKKPERTLDGKKAGLQDLVSFQKEAIGHHLREEESLSKLSDELSGRNAATVVRDRATGKKRDIAREAEEKRAEKEKENEMKEKYMKWGKGLKQVEDQISKREDDLYEMSKPLARYADDEDLERHLRDREREGDPMQEYVKTHQVSKDKEIESSGVKKVYPVYQGPQPPPNRFGIKPGYRWDGVDRSTGYEKKWFEEENARKALKEEAYKWSIEDM